MNPGPIESGEHVATSLIDSLKAQPATLSLVVVIIVFLGAVMWTAGEQRKVQHEEMLELLAQAKQMQEWLYRCTPTGQQHTELPIPQPRPPELGPSLQQGEQL